MKEKFISKKNYKRRHRCCRICGEKNYTLLDVHRIFPGEEGGHYEVNNCVTLCCSCHRLVHAGEIKIHGWVHSTKGDMLWIERGGKEEFL